MGLISTCVALAQNEAFVGELYKPTVEAFTPRGTYHVLPELQHMDVIYAPRTAKLIVDWLLD